MTSSGWGVDVVVLVVDKQQGDFRERWVYVERLACSVNPQEKSLLSVLSAVRGEIWWVTN